MYINRFANVEWARFQKQFNLTTIKIVVVFKMKKIYIKIHIEPQKFKDSQDNPEKILSYTAQL